MSSQSKKRKAALKEIRELKLEKRNSIMRIVLCILAIVAVLLIKTALEVYGILASSNFVVHVIVMIITIALAVVAGNAGMKISHNSSKIKELQRRFEFSADELK